MVIPCRQHPLHANASKTCFLQQWREISLRGGENSIKDREKCEQKDPGYCLVSFPNEQEEEQSGRESGLAEGIAVTNKEDSLREPGVGRRCRIRKRDPDQNNRIINQIAMEVQTPEFPPSL